MASKPDDEQTGHPQKGPRRRWAAAFLKALRETKSVSHACQASGVKSRTTAYNFRKECERFRREWDEAWADIVDELEQSAMDRAINGHDDLELHQGEICKDDDGNPIVRRKFESALTIFMLKKNRPDRYGDESIGEAAEEIAGAVRDMVEAMSASIPTIPPPPEPSNGEANDSRS